MNKYWDKKKTKTSAVRKFWENLVYRFSREGREDRFEIKVLERLRKSDRTFKGRNKSSLFVPKVYQRAERVSICAALKMN
jgi:hypothetical protein